MPQVNVTVSANSEIELLNRKKTIDKVNELSTDQLKRLLHLVESPKAKDYLSSDLKFAFLKKFL